MIKKGKFKIPIYDFTLEVVVLSDIYKLEEYYKSLRIHLKFEKDENDSLSQGLVLTKGFNMYMLLAESKLTNSLITHEASHAVYRILNTNNIPIQDSEETFALLTGFINEGVYKIITKLGCKII